MQKEPQFILVTDWEKVQSDDFYLSKDWAINQEMERVYSVNKAKKLQKENNLYVAYIVPALSYAIYTQMDSNQVFIDNDMNVILSCETAIISNNHDKRIEYDY